MKNKNHDKIVAKQEKLKQRHLDKLATKMLEQDEKMQQLKNFKMGKNPLDFFK